MHSDAASQSGHPHCLVFSRLSAMRYSAEGGICGIGFSIGSAAHPTRLSRVSHLDLIISVSRRLFLGSTFPWELALLPITTRAVHASRMNFTLESRDDDVRLGLYLPFSLSLSLSRLRLLSFPSIEFVSWIEASCCT